MSNASKKCDNCGTTMFVRDFGEFGTLCVNCAAMAYIDFGDMLEFYSYEIEEEVVDKIIECGADYKVLDNIREVLGVVYKVSLRYVIRKMIVDLNVDENMAFKLLKYLRMR